MVGKKYDWKFSIGWTVQVVALDMVKLDQNNHIPINKTTEKYLRK